MSLPREAGNEWAITSDEWIIPYCLAYFLPLCAEHPIDESLLFTLGFANGVEKQVARQRILAALDRLEGCGDCLGSLFSSRLTGTARMPDA